MTVIAVRWALEQPNRPNKAIKISILYILASKNIVDNVEPAKDAMKYGPENGVTHRPANSNS